MHQGVGKDKARICGIGSRYEERDDLAGKVGMYGRKRAAIFEQLLEFEPREKAKLVDAPHPRELVTEEPVIDPQTGEPRRDGQGEIIMRPVVPPVLTPSERLWERLPRIMGDDA